jgi:hypothetical protein
MSSEVPQGPTGFGFCPGDLVCFRVPSLKNSVPVPILGNIVAPVKAKESLPDSASVKSLRVNWFEFGSLVDSLEDVGLVDRKLIPEQRVRNSKGLSGKVTRVVTTVSAQLLNSNNVVVNIPVTDLRPVTVR